MSDILERLRKLVAMHGDDTDTDTLRALLAERDIWRDENTKKQVTCERMGARITALEAERDEAVAALAIYRMEHGCTRGQRTTQWCGEAIRLREALERAADTLSDVGLLDAWADARAALKETGHE